MWYVLIFMSGWLLAILYSYIYDKLMIEPAEKKVEQSVHRLGKSAGRLEILNGLSREPKNMKESINKLIEKLDKENS